MQENTGISLAELQTAAALRELRDCNEATARFGLKLSEGQMHSLVVGQRRTLSATGRIEFGEGILKRLILAFCDSPYLCQQNYEATIAQLQECFYYFKNESGGALSDDELVAFMAHIFNGRAHGSLDYLSGTALEELCRAVREGRGRAYLEGALYE